MLIELTNMVALLWTFSSAIQSFLYITEYTHDPYSKRCLTSDLHNLTISKSGQKWTLPAQLGQLITGQDGRGFICGAPTTFHGYGIE